MIPDGRAASRAPLEPMPLPAVETLRFLERALPPSPARVLEVGCGDGLVASALALRGYEVTALDESLAIDEAAGRAAAAHPVRWVETNFLFYEGADDGAPFDAVLFTRSLHHLSPLDRALDRAAELLRPGGSFVAEEFAVDRVTLQTARWWYDTEALLVAADLLPPPDPALEAVRNPLGRWRQEHAHDPPLASGHDMLAAARERFRIGPAEEAPYLYRYAHERARPGEIGARVVARIFEIESRLIRERDIAAAGLRVTGTLPE
ncbi:MAG TPA: class I SAM-dependent methyltransferase [Candidatus Eisenbacteria bacterium]|nr:class I SAM-dependent methyltransferase [Candidatus Eisenbacteria bacterium]